MQPRAISVPGRLTPLRLFVSKAKGLPSAFDCSSQPDKLTDLLDETSRYPMAAASSLTAVQPVVGQALRGVIDEFRGILDEEQRRELDALKPVPDTDAILVFTAKLDGINRSRRGRSVASRLHTILLAVRNFCSIADTFVSSHPEIAALVWGSVKLTMLIMSNFTSYYEATSNLFMRVGRLCPLFHEYLILYRTSTRLRQSLLDFHTSIVYCCKHVVEAAKRPLSTQIFQALWNSFEQEFMPDLDDIERCSNKVKEEIALAKAQADAQEHQLQALEREKAFILRRTARGFFSRTDNTLDSMREWRVQSDTRKIQKRRQQLLDSLSTYDHLRLLKQSRLKRYRNTSNWIAQTPEFHRWVDGAVPLLCCFGKIGSGKTIATASVIDHILSTQGSDCVISFFFVDSGNQRSLSADTIIRSLLRQRLNPTDIPQDVMESLERLDPSSGVNDLVKLLRIMMPPARVSYIVIDGLDECEKPDRDKLLTALSSLVLRGENIRLFLSSRESLRGEIEKRYPAFDSLSMSCPSAYGDISSFIEDTVREKIQNDELAIGDPSLEEDIKLALFHGAQGMFLWVTFQIDEICAQHCDEDIRNTLKDLPKSLTELYCRVLQRIKSRGHGKAALKIFPWIVASKQLLSLSQLREAIAIEIGQQYTRPERLYNDIKNISSWCENLVQVDEEYQLVQFAHSTIRKLLIEEALDSTLAEFRVNLEEADHDIGEICVTYLNFNDFTTTVARRAKPILLPSTAQMAQSALGYRSKSVSMLAKLHPPSASKPVELRPLQNLMENNASVKYQKLVLGYPFLEYASTTWILHTRNFRQEKTKTWRLWGKMVIQGHNLATVPWGDNTFDANGPVLEWAYDARHYPLLRLVASSSLLSDSRKSRILYGAVHNNDTDVLGIFLDPHDLSTRLNHMLYKAAERGNLEVVEMLLATNAEVNAIVIPPIADTESHRVCKREPYKWREGETALQVAARNGHLRVVERLLASQADVNIRNPAGLTALQAAVDVYHPEIVERLLTAGANVNEAPINGPNALELAAGRGYLKVVEKLLSAKADVNASAFPARGPTALQAAAGIGHLEIVENLLSAKANVNAPASPNGGKTALQAAAWSGSLMVVERLIAAKADINAPGAPEGGETALQAAKRRGHREIQLRLKEAGARG
ncbi:hypothetical protein ANO14919_129030 [Xylariales sp. No.14919]|nr:hypothetical protein ANO14919_129030 [Xylariales sp. No.14919]